MISLDPVIVSGKTVRLQMREGQKRSADHAPHIEVEARCGTTVIVRAHTLASNHKRTSEELERDIAIFARQVAEECAGHEQSHALLDNHLQKHRHRGNPVG